MIAVLTLIAQAGCTSVFGCVSPPPGVVEFGAEPSGLIIFVSNMIKVITLIAGFVGLFNVISAGYTYLSSAGDPKAVQGATQKLVYSGIGLLVMVAAFTIISVVSFLIFGDASFILNPVLPTPTTPIP